MEGPPLGPGGEDITWPDQVAPRGRKASSTRKIKPQTSNLGAILVHARHRGTTGVLNGSPQCGLDSCWICGIWLLFRVEGGLYFIFYIFGFGTLEFDKCNR